MQSFLAAKAVCDAVGWDYNVFSWVDRTYRLNIEWLAGYRHPRNAPPPECETKLLNLYAQPRRICEAAAALPNWNPPLITAWSYHMTWKRTLMTDLRTKLTEQHVFQAAQDA
ncbi:hypothetical protein GCM10022381_26010 [Leifsonia kafniensis]|uniref:Uncharacterized protein n=2 Tax=Leifsonia kafniensis TaxID=475957 RepID=A0ABP7KQQ5_9MICO